MTNKEEILRDLLLSALDCGGSDLNKLLEIIETGINKKFTLNDEEIYLLPHNWASDVWDEAKAQFGYVGVNVLISVTFDNIKREICSACSDYDLEDCINLEVDFMASSMSFNKERFLEANLDISLDYHGDYNEAIKSIADEIETIISEF
jgi:hypothetical protein